MRHVYWSGAVLALLAVGTAAPAAPVPGKVDLEALTPVPASAPMVVHLRGIEGTKDRLLVLVKAIVPEFHDVAKAFLDAALKDGFDGRKLTAMVKDGPVYAVFTDLSDLAGDEPKMAIVVAVTKYADFRDGLLKDDEKKGIKANPAGFDEVKTDNGKMVYFIDKKGFAVITPNKDVAGLFCKKQDGLDKKISMDQAARFLNGDLGVYLSMDELNKQYGEQIKAAKTTVIDAIKAAAGNLPAAQKPYIEIGKDIIAAAFQTVEDSKGLLATIEFRPGGLALHMQSELRPDSTTAKALKDSKAVAFKDLGKLPAGATFYTGMALDPTLTKALGSLLFGALSDPDSKEGKAIAAAAEQIFKAGPGELTISSSLPPSGVQVGAFKDPKAALEGQMKLMDAVQAGGLFQQGFLKEKPIVKKDAETYKDIKFTSVKLVWDLEKMAEAQDPTGALPEEVKKAMNESMKKLLGEGMNLWVGADAGRLIQVQAKDWAAAQKLLDDFFAGKQAVGDVAAFVEARKELPDQANVLYVVDMVQYLAVVIDMMKPVFGAIPGVALPPGFPPAPGKAKPTFVGTAVGLSGDRLTFDFVLTASAARSAYETFVKPLLGGGGN